jgi:DNA ligase-1
MSPIRGWCWKSRSKACNARSRHKSGVAMRFPRINRLRWDKPPREADRLETLERLLKSPALSEASEPGSD